MGLAHIDGVQGVFIVSASIVKLFPYPQQVSNIPVYQWLALLPPQLNILPLLIVGPSDLALGRKNGRTLSGSST